MTESSEPTVFLVDDDLAVLDSMSRLLRSEGLRTECFSSADQFLCEVGVHRVGCLVVDLRMPGKSGIDLLQTLSTSRVSRQVVVISGYAEITSVVQSMKLGASDFLQKPFPPSKLIDTVRSALELEVRSRHAEKLKCQSEQRIHALAEEERIILAGIVRGLTNQQLADEMGISLRTVQFRRASLFESLGVKTKTELLAIVQEARWSFD